MKMGIKVFKEIDSDEKSEGNYLGYNYLNLLPSRKRNILYNKNKNLL